MAQIVKQHTRSVKKSASETDESTTHTQSAALSGQLAGCYKIKLRNAGYRLVYQVVDQKLQIIVIAVGKRDKQQAYHIADQRIASKSTDTLPSE